jgi:hypothetical protein
VVVLKMSGRMPRSERQVESYRTPVGIDLGAGTVMVLVGVVVAAMLPASAGWWRLVPVVVALVVFSALTVYPTAVAFVATVAYLLVLGFLVDRYGVLAWHGVPDIHRLLVIVLSADAGFAFGLGRRWMRRRRPLLVPAEWAAPTTGAKTLTCMDEEDIPGG